jgi:hypothetical protein
MVADLWHMETFHFSGKVVTFFNSFSCTIVKYQHAAVAVRLGLVKGK